MATQAKYFHEVFSSRLGIWQNILPHLVMAMTVPLSGLVADILRMKTSSTTTRVRKIFTCVGLGGEMIFLMLAGQANNQPLASAALTLAVASGALSRSKPHICHFFSTEIFSTHIFIHIDLEQNVINFDETLQIVQFFYRKSKFLHMTVFSPRI